MRFYKRKCLVTRKVPENPKALLFGAKKGPDTSVRTPESLFTPGWGNPNSDVKSACLLPVPKDCSCGCLVCISSLRALAWNQPEMLDKSFEGTLV